MTAVAEAPPPDLSFLAPHLREYIDGHPGTEHLIEAFRSGRDVAYFVDTYCQIFDPPDEGDPLGDWMPFRLWPSQRPALAALRAYRLLVWLKARQLGMTWLALAYVLHTLLFTSGAVVLLFSLRDTEAKDLLERLKGMYRRLPDFLRFADIQEGNDHEWEFPNGSKVRAFPTTAGDSYTATLVVVDEADLVPDLLRLLGSVKPTIDAGGKLLLLGRVDKSDPESTFKKIYRAAVLGKNSYKPLFLPWSARPDRTPEWYEEQKRDSLANTGALDWLHEHYPNTDTEALAPASLDKRIPPAWLEQCFKPEEPLFTLGVDDDFGPKGCPGIPGLRVWIVPNNKSGRRYVVGVDPAEGNPSSDDSALCILDDLGNQAAELAGKIDPSTLGFYADRLAGWYNSGSVMVERNNHGQGVLAWWKGNGKCRLLRGHDNKDGWLSNHKGKVLLYDECAEAFQHKSTVLRSFEAWVQLSSIEGNTLKAPEGLHDDRADAYALAVAGLPQTRGAAWKLRTF
jgi:hypothetical protein